ncbi:MAG: DUF484 family protein [Pseudomonadota bacterium]
MSVEAIDEANVIEWLRENPGALQRHPDVLAELELRHEAGAGTSLIEHQVAVLRDQIAGLKDKLRDYHESAEANEVLFRRVHDLYLDMLRVGTGEELVALVTRRLTADFGCDAASIGQLAPGATVAGVRGLAAAGPLFDEVVKAGSPICGRLATQRLEAVFAPDDVAEIRSAAVIPWGVPTAGLLVLGSRDERKFYPGMGTLFLELLGQMLGQRLAALTADEHDAG